MIKSQRIPQSIWILGVVSLLMDTSSELIHSVLPIFMISTLGLTITSVGVIEGIAEATALIVKIFSGTLSDYFQQRKTLTLIGYGIAALTKPIFPLAQGITSILLARFIDRVGKGIRGAPRDALIGDLAPPEIRGRCFGLRQSLDTVGAILGPLLAMAGLIFFANNIRIVLWFAVIPAILCVSLLSMKVREPIIHREKILHNPLHWKNLAKLSSHYWGVVIIAMVLSLARFSEAFLIIKAQTTGMSLVWIPLIMVLMNIVYALGAYPVGILADHINRKALLVIAIVFLIVADILLGASQHMIALLLGVIFWGLHLAFSQGLFATMVTDTAPVELRGTAYGIFYFTSGIAFLVSNIIAGLLWDHYGSAIPFFMGGLLALISLVGLIV